jgi:osmoprotectant transport system permease protein
MSFSILKSDAITIGSKPFTESYVLAELMAQVIESETNLEVERRFGMQGTFTSFTATTEGSIDLYPEYTGTGALAILKSNDPADQQLDSLRAKFSRRWGLTWLEPFGFNNTWAIVVKRPFALEHNLTTISDLARIPGVQAAFTHEFMQRADGYPGLVATYDLRFAQVRGIQHILAYDALRSGQIDVMDAYATDGEVARYDLVVLEDDQGFFPVYLAAPLIREETLERYPELAVVLNRFAWSISGEQMQAVNHRAAQAGDDYPRIVAEFIQERTGPSERGDPVSAQRSLPQLIQQTARHLLLMGIAVVLAILVAIPGGILLVGRPRLAGIVLGFAGVVQTIPSIAMLGFMIPLLGIGVIPAIAALFIYGLLPIIRNTHTGIRDISPALLEVAEGLGLDRSHRLRWLELPLAAPVIFAGVRTAAVISVGTATLAAFIGAGGLGEPIVQGLSFNDPRMILSGAIPAALLAVLVDGLLGWLERRLRPGGLAHH